MNPKTPILSVCSESLDDDSANLDETVGLPVLMVPDHMKDSNDADAGPSPRAAQRQSAYLIELGESINKNLERIAAALESRQTPRKRSAKKRKVAAKPKTTAEKPANSRKKRRKTVAKKTSQGN